ncbi:hypothetical protein TNCV_3359061 [Trichonephila clavipes]|nr:hypothetical protein TNCV_3359061 [Trichonephila clavipes]
MSHLDFFAYANVFHNDGQPVPIELSIDSIPEDGKDPEGKVLSPGPSKQRFHRRQGIGTAEKFEKLGFFTINLKRCPISGT